MKGPRHRKINVYMVGLIIYFLYCAYEKVLYAPHNDKHKPKGQNIKLKWINSYSASRDN